MTMDQDCPGKVTHCRHFFFLISIAWSVEEDDTLTKEKPAAKMEKPQNELRSKTTKIKFDAIFNVFVSRLVLA